MSGEWDDDWVHYKLQTYAERVLDRSPTNPLHVAFSAYLLRVSTAVKELTWEFSNDTGEGDADSAIRGLLASHDELAAALELANVAAKNLQEIMERANSGVHALKAKRS